jgi:thiosulfate dehydrogenase (quinone) large subunit
LKSNKNVKFIKPFFYFNQQINMKLSELKIIEWFLRVSLSISFLSAVADRFGLWGKEVSVWGNWENFLTYTKQINPLLPDVLIPIVGGVATFLEVLFVLLLLTTYQTKLVAKGSGILLLLFALAMTFSVGIKAPLDYSVFSAAAASFGLSWVVNFSHKA